MLAHETRRSSAAWEAGKGQTDCTVKVAGRQAATGFVTSSRLKSRISAMPVSQAAESAPAADARLLEAVTAGEPGAFDAFVERYGRRLFAFGLRMCGHREDAEDVFQDTLLKAYQGLSELRDPGAVRTWLYRVASNQCLMNRRGRQPARELPLADFKPAGWESGEMAPIADWSARPDEAAHQAELREVLEAAILELPPDFKVVVLLRDVEGLSTREAAEALGIGEGAVKMRLHRARLALRQRLERYFEGDGGAAEEGA
jgi:RNA polymerase sigma-70 factor (ECF subfamily)